MCLLDRWCQISWQQLDHTNKAPRAQTARRALFGHYVCYFFSANRNEANDGAR